jgi:hypothetical protein
MLGSECWAVNVKEIERKKAMVMINSIADFHSRASKEFHQRIPPKFDPKIC